MFVSFQLQVQGRDEQMKLFLGYKNMKEKIPEPHEWKWCNWAWASLLKQKITRDKSTDIGDDISIISLWDNTKVTKKKRCLGGPESECSQYMSLAYWPPSRLLVGIVSKISTDSLCLPKPNVASFQLEKSLTTNAESFVLSDKFIFPSFDSRNLIVWQRQHQHSSCRKVIRNSKIRTAGNEMELSLAEWFLGKRNIWWLVGRLTDVWQL